MTTFDESKINRGDDGKFGPKAHEAVDTDLGSVSPVKSRTGQVLVSDGVRIDWDELGEGEFGEYNEDDPNDTEFLRFTIYRASDEDGDDGWAEVEGGSWCSRIPVDTDDETRDAALWTLMDHHGDDVRAGDDRINSLKFADMKVDDISPWRTKYLADEDPSVPGEVFVDDGVRVDFDDLNEQGGRNLSFTFYKQREDGGWDRVSGASHKTTMTMSTDRAVRDAALRTLMDRYAPAIRSGGELPRDRYDGMTANDISERHRSDLRMPAESFTDEGLRITRRTDSTGNLNDGPDGEPAVQSSWTNSGDRRGEARYDSGHLQDSDDGEPAIRMWHRNGRVAEERRYISGLPYNGPDGEPATQRWSENGTRILSRSAADQQKILVGAADLPDGELDDPVQAVTRTFADPDPDDAVPFQNVADDPNN